MTDGGGQRTERTPCPRKTRKDTKEPHWLRRTTDEGGMSILIKLVLNPLSTKGTKRHERTPLTAKGHGRRRHIDCDKAGSQPLAAEGFLSCLFVFFVDRQLGFSGFFVCFSCAFRGQAVGFSGVFSCVFRVLFVVRSGRASMKPAALLCTQ